MVPAVVEKDKAYTKPVLGSSVHETADVEYKRPRIGIVRHRVEKDSKGSQANGGCGRKLGVEFTCEVPVEEVWGHPQTV